MSIDKLFTSVNAPATKDDILRWEQKMNVHIPEQYKIFLLKFNGANIDQNVTFSYESLANKQIIEDGLFKFMSLEEMKGEFESIANSEENIRLNYCIDELIPIAYNHCHSCMTMIGYTGREPGKIILLDYLEDLDEDGKFQKIYLAESFDVFFEMLEKSID